LLFNVSAADKLTLVVVLPTPPFWLHIENILLKLLTFIFL
tara:strand:- start:581 stop:700 length:120 start_codon:yes stop_codon:yes gene_type:complete